MSAIARCYLVDATKIDGIRSIADWDALVLGVPEVAYTWSGYVLGTLLPYLDEQGIALMDSELGDHLCDLLDATVFVLTTDHRRLLDRLDAAKFSGSALRRYHEEFNQTPGAGVEQPMLDGIRFFHDAVGRLQDGTVGVLVIG